MTITRNQVAEYIKTYADGCHSSIKNSLGHNGSSWAHPWYAGGIWAICDGIADSVNQEISAEIAARNSAITAAITAERALREANQEVQRLKINEIIDALSQLIVDYNNAFVPTIAIAPTPLE